MLSSPESQLKKKLALDGRTAAKLPIPMTQSLCKDSKSELVGWGSKDFTGTPRKSLKAAPTTLLKKNPKKPPMSDCPVVLADHVYCAAVEEMTAATPVSVFRYIHFKH